MGQSQSPPLSLLIANFRDVRTRGQNLSLDIRRGKLITLCHSEWPTFGVGWPTEGTFCLPIIAKVKSKIFLPGREGHPDQIPYILVWRNLVENPPPWLAPFLSSGTCKVLAMRPADPPKSRTRAAPLYPISPDSQDLLSLDPPPYHPPPLVTQALPAAAAPPVAPLPNPRLPDSTVALPRWEIGPPDETGNSRLQYWPFSTSDVYNWKTQNARFSDNPKDLIALLDSVLFTHQPTWDDCQQLLRILFTTEERERIQLEARKLVPGDDGRPTSNPDLINAAFPLTRPPQDEWDYNTPEGRGRLLIYRQTLMAGLRAAARKPTNLAKVYSVIQGKAESPAAYLERLMEAFRQFTPMDPEVPENQAAVVMSFVNQAAPDIKKKLQRLEDLEGKQIQDLGHRNKEVPLDNSEDCGLGNWEGNPLLPGHSRQPLPPVGEGFAYQNGGPNSFPTGGTHSD
uniref:Core shell protein Gag P30 domain-containing protein n=1 Tax=Lynx canadensis TaxID=61383 RepID=A0A667HG64_LYNCA